METAISKSISPAQLTLAWLLHQGNDVVLIRGTRKRNRSGENAAAAEIALNAGAAERIFSLAAAGIARELCCCKLFLQRMF